MRHCWWPASENLRRDELTGVRSVAVTVVQRLTDARSASFRPFKGAEANVRYDEPDDDSCPMLRERQIGAARMNRTHEIADVPRNKMLKRHVDELAFAVRLFRINNDSAKRSRCSKPLTGFGRFGCNPCDLAVLDAHV